MLDPTAYPTSPGFVKMLIYAPKSFEKCSGANAVALMWGLDDNSMDSMGIYYYSLFHSLHFLVDFPYIVISI